MERHDPIFGRRVMHTGDKHGLLGDKGPFCKCMECARLREERLQRENQDVLDRLCDKLDPVIVRDANAQKLLRKVTAEVEEILTNYDEADSICGSLILNKLREYHRAS